LAVALLVALFAPLNPTTSSDTPVYVEAARSLAAGDGYHAASEPTGVPRYPPGLPLLLVPAALLSHGDGALQATSMLLGLLLLVMIWVCASELAGPIGGIASGGLMVSSLLLMHAGTAVMSDTPAALATVCALWLTIRARDRWSGFAAGCAALIRMTAVPYVFLLRRRAWLTGGVVLAVLAAFQLIEHGSVFGYSGSQATFGVHYLAGGTVWEAGTNPSVMPNWEFYPRYLLTMPLLTFTGVAGLVLERRTAGARFGTRVCVSTLAVYAVYYFQSTRFLLPVVSVLAVYGAVAVSRTIAAAGARSGRTITSEPSDVGVIAPIAAG